MGTSPSASAGLPEDDEQAPTPGLIKRLKTMAWPITLALLFAYALTMFVPWAPTPPPAAMEAGWFMVLHWAFLNGANFGNEIIFTYGPWGFLLQGYHPSTFLYTVIGWAFFTSVCFLAMTRIAEGVSSRRWVQAMWVLGLLTLVGTSVPGMQDIRLFVICWALLLLHFHVDRRPLTGLKVAFALAVALLSLAKFSLAIVALLVVLAVSVDLMSRRLMPWLLCIYLGAVGVLWLAAGQNLLSIVPYVRHSIEITSGYAQGVGRDSLHEARDVGLFILCAMLLLGVAGAVYVMRFLIVRLMPESPIGKQAARAGMDVWLGPGALAAGLFLMFKMGYVRHDTHEMLATTGLSALALMYLAALLPIAGGRTVRGALIAMPVGCLALTWWSLGAWVLDGAPSALLQPVIEFPWRTGLVFKTLAGSNSNRQSYDQMLQYYRDIEPLPKVPGPVDGYSWIQYRIFANAMDYRPRPVMQGYLAYTQELGRINADFLRGPRAPDSIYFDVQNIDDWYPSLGDAACWPQLLARYRVRDVRQSALLLEHALESREPSFVPLRTNGASLNEWVDVPASSRPIWATITLSPTITGRVAQAIYKPAELYINYVTSSGATNRARLIPGIAGGGFLLSPVIPDRQSFALLWSDKWQEQLAGLEVRRVQIVAKTLDGTTTAYDPRYEIRFEELTYPSQDMATVAGMADYLRFRQFVRGAQPVGSDIKRVITNEDMQLVLASPAPTRWLIDVPPSASTVRVGFGVVRASWAGLPRGDPVEFVVHAARLSPQNSLQISPIWSRRLDPANVERDRGSQVTEIRLPSPPPDRLMLETLGGPNTSALEGYWSDVEFR